MHMTEVSISKINADDFITEHKVPVIAGGRNYGSLPFGWKKRRRDALRASATELLQPILPHKLETEVTDNLSKGEAHIVSAAITSNFEKVCRALTKDVHTCYLLLNTFDGSPESNESMFGMYEELNDVLIMWKPNRTHELIVFNDARDGLPQYRLANLLDDIRMSHPMFAYEDLSDLKPEELELAKKLLSVANENYKAADNRLDKKNDREGIRYSAPLADARRKIFQHTPQMTPALAKVFIDHPERVDDVLRMLSDRNVPVHLADGMIEEAVAAPMPLSDGAL